MDVEGLKSLLDVRYFGMSSRNLVWFLAFTALLIRCHPLRKAQQRPHHRVHHYHLILIRLSPRQRLLGDDGQLRSPDHHRQSAGARSRAYSGELRGAGAGRNRNI